LGSEEIPSVSEMASTTLLIRLETLEWVYEEHQIE